MAKHDITSLINQVKTVDRKTTIQKVVPVKKKNIETLFSVYIPTEKLKRLKMISAKNGISIKELINKALDEKYFED